MKKKTRLPKIPEKSRYNNGYQKKPFMRRDYLKSKLRTIFFAVTFTKFIKNEASKLSKARKNNLRKFWQENFHSQINNIKNWLLESQKYSLSIILEKGELDFDFSFLGLKPRVREQKEVMVMQLVHIGIKKLKENCTSQRISLFSEILVNFCRRGSFAMNRFWTAHEMEQICISEYYGFFRIDPSLEKFLIGVLVFIKVFIFNLFLQPHKFDEDNFPKHKEPLNSNMSIVSSVYYHLIKDIL